MRSKKTILVTGGCGFIGTNLIDYLLNKKFKVVNLDKLSNTSNVKHRLNKKVIFIKNDLSNEKKLFSILKKFKPDGVIHLAAETHVDRSIDDSGDFIKSNIIGTYNLLKSSQKYIKIFKAKFKFIIMGTDEIFGDLPLKSKKGFGETATIKPNNPYSASKASAVHLARAWYKTYNLPIIQINCSNNFGPFQYFEKLLPTIIFKILNNKSVGIYGNGKNERDWIYVGDHVRAIYKIFLKGKIGETYNVGGEKSFSNLSFVNLVYVALEDILGKKIKKQISLIKDRPGHDKKYLINASKVKRLGWKKKHEIFFALKKTIKWYLKKENLNYFKIKKYKFSRLGLK
jgi:dTDP-glucose 4,6-dehydratase